MALRRRPSSSVGAHALVNLTIVISAAGLTAFAALLAENWMGPDRVRGRIIMTLIFLASLVIAIALRSAVRAQRGTLYYVRLLEAGMRDQHVENRHRWQNRHMDARVVARSVHRLPVGGVLDLADDVADISQALQETMNNDSSSTGFQLAPNLLWPAALAVGYDWYAREHSALEELPSSAGGRVMSWNLRSPSRSFNTPAMYRASHAADASGTDVILLSVYLTPQTEMHMVPWVCSQDFRLAVLDPLRSKNAVAVGESSAIVSIAPEDFAARVQPVLMDTPGRFAFGRAASGHTRDGPARVHPFDAAAALAASIRTLLHAFDETPILLSVRASKTVVFATGWMLSNGTPDDRGLDLERCTAHESCRNPWSRLIPIVTPMVNAAPPTIWRVHPGQPGATILAARVGRGSL